MKHDTQAQTAPSTQQPLPQFIDLTPIFRAIWRAKWAISALVILVAILSILVVATITPTYRATATLLIDNQKAQVVSIEQIYGLDGSGNNYLTTQFNLLKSRAIAERVVKQLQLTEHPDFDPRQDQVSLFSLANVKMQLKNAIPSLQDPETLDEQPELTDEQIFDRVVRRVQGVIEIEPVRGSNLVLIHVDVFDRELAPVLANAIARGYIENQLDASLEMTTMATQWMNSRLEELRSTLQISENRLQAYLDSQNLIDLGGVTNISSRELDELNRRLVDARRARAEVESEYNQIQRIRSQGWEGWATTPAVMRNNLVQTFRTEEARSQARVDELSLRYGPRHPSMVAARSDLEAARTSLRMQVEQIVAGIERNFQIAVANEDSLRRSYEENKSTIQDISRAEFRLRELQREVDTNQALFDTFLTRLRETTATADLETVNARIADPAVVPSSPIKPRKSLLVFLMSVLAGLVGVGLTVLLTILSNTFKRIEDIENNLNLPVYGLLPKVGKIKQRRDLVARFLSAQDRPFVESVKSIRTSISLSSLDKPYKIIMVTSSLPGEGKSVTATNIALAMTQVERTLLIEADMRKPTLAKTLDMPIGTVGLANLIAGSVSLEEAVYKVGDLAVIPAGLVPPNPLELLSSTKFEAILAELSAYYDRIIIDSPPVNAVSDALILSRLANAVLFVIKSDATPQPQVKAALGKLLQSNAPVKGVILNQVDVKKARKDGDAYAGYYDYYGYSQTAKS